MPKWGFYFRCGRHGIASVAEITKPRKVIIYLDMPAGHGGGYVSPMRSPLMEPVSPGTQALRAAPNRRGKTKREIIRCLKRYVARELFDLLPQELELG